MRRLLLAALLLAIAAHPVAAQTPAPPAPVAPPTNIRPGLVTSGSIEVLWDDVATDETRYELLHAPIGASGVLLPLSASSASWTLTDLPPGTEYWFRVRACRDAICSTAVGTLLVQTLTAPTATPTSMPTDTPTPAPTATSTPAPCPGTYLGAVIEHNTLTVTCVKPTEVAWPDAIEFRDWRVQP